MKVTILLVIASCLLVACQQGEPANASDEASVAVVGVAPAVNTREPPVHLRPALPTPAQEALGCRGAFVQGKLQMRPRPGGAAAGSCGTHPKSATPHFLDDCDPVGWTSDCRIEPGAQFCMNRQWTAICLTDAQCPSGTRCTDGLTVGAIDTEYSDYGWCAPTCSAKLGKSACSRCDLECEADLEVCVRVDRPSPGAIAKFRPGPRVKPTRHPRATVPVVYRPPVSRASE